MKLSRGMSVVVGVLALCSCNKKSDVGFERSEQDQPEVTVKNSDQPEVTDSRFSEIYKYPVNYSNNFLIGVCEMPKDIHQCSRDYLISNVNGGDIGGTFGIFGKNEKVSIIYASNGSEIIDKNFTASVEYFSTRNDYSRILVIRRGMDFDQDCYFPTLYRQAGDDIFATTMAAIGKCSDMAVSGASYEAAKGEKLINYVRTSSR